MNSVNLSGRLTADPELRRTQNSTAVCSFTLAVQRPHVKDTTDFINCVAWRQSAEYLTQYGKKGAWLEVSGAFTTRKYEDSNGNKRTAYEITCDSVKLPVSGSSNDSQQKYATPELEDVYDDGDLPF